MDWDVLERDEEIRECLHNACDCEDWHWFRNEDGTYECDECRLVIDM